MKKIYTLLATALLICASTTVNAKSWRINSNVKAKADFTSVAEAIASEKVVDDDELYLEPGHVEPDGITLTKRLHLIGPGYWNVQAASNVNHASNAIITGQISIRKSGSGSNITGCVLNGYNYFSGEISENVTIERCLIYGNIEGSNTSAWNIINCFIYGSIHFTGKGNTVIGNIMVVNGYDVIQIGIGSTISNNTIIGDNSSSGYPIIRSIDQCTFTNNIVINKSTSPIMKNNSSAYITNNIIGQSEVLTSFPNNNYAKYTLEDIFKMEGDPDEMYELKENSPAKGYGTHGTDCGAYGGERPYVKGGYPQLIPVIYDVTVPNHPTDGKLPVQLKIRTQND